MSVQDMIVVIGNKTMLCNDPRRIPNKNLWFHGNPLESPTSLLLLQLSAISIVSQLIDLCLKPLGQSTIVSQIFAGMVFGPSLLGHKKIMASSLFPARGSMVIETVATYGLMYYLFLMGVRSDSTMMMRPGRQGLIIGFSVFFFTFVLCGLATFILVKSLPMEASISHSIFFVAGAQTLTGFPVISSLLRELKMLNTDIGHLALSSSMFCDVLGISMTAVALSIMGPKTSGPLTPLYSILSSVALVATIVYVFRPAILWMLNRAPKGRPMNEMLILSIFVLVPLTGFMSETIGQHYVFGPLILGLAVPDGPPLGVALVTKLDTFASGLFYPTYLAISGLRTNIFKIHFQGLGVVGIVVFFSCLVKIGSVMVPAVYSDVPVREAFVLGLIINARGIVELMVFNLWRDTMVLTDEGFALSVISVIMVTAIITPLIRILHDPSRQFIAIKRSTIQHTKREADLRILVCIHNQDNVSMIVNLLEVSGATEESKIAVIALILVELVGRSVPVLVAHQPHSALPTSTSSTSRIINALRQFENQNEGFVTVEPFTSISPFETMHSDVCRVAVDKRATMVILPFHKQWAIDGSIGSVNRAFRGMNVKVLESAPCSVGILIDRGILSGSISLLTGRPLYHVAVIYIGGADDAESLAYGSRMAKEESVDLTVVQFLLFGAENTKDRKRDSDLIDEYRHANAGNERFVIIEEVVRDGSDLASSIKEMVDCFDLIVTGKDHPASSLLTGLGAWSECPELGIIGDMLASPDIGSTASALVVQQQRLGGKLINRTTQPAVGDRDQLIHDVAYDEPSRGSWSISMGRS